MKKIYTFQQFINENKINEGGGAGVTITLDDTLYVTAVYVLSANSVFVEKTKVDMGESFAAEGYDDGMSNVGTWLLKVDDVNLKQPARSRFDAIKLTFMDDRDKQLFIESLSHKEYTEEEWDIMDTSFETIGDVFEHWPDLKIPLNISLSIKNYKEQHFGGWVRGSIKVGSTVIGNDGGDLDDSSEILIGEDDYALYTNGEDVLADLLNYIRPDLVATEEFEKFWNAVFQNQDSNYESYAKDELKYRITEDDDETYHDYVEEYFDEEDPEIVSLEDFVKNYDTYKEAFEKWFLSDDTRRNLFWDTFIESQQDSWSPSNKPDKK
jgi:hypothetical protein